MGLFPYTCRYCQGGFYRCGNKAHHKDGEPICTGDQFCWEQQCVVVPRPQGEQEFTPEWNDQTPITNALYSGYGYVTVGKEDDTDTIYISDEFKDCFKTWRESFHIDHPGKKVVIVGPVTCQSCWDNNGFSRANLVDCNYQTKDGHWQPLSKLLPEFIRPSKRNPSSDDGVSKESELQDDAWLHTSVLDIIRPKQLEDNNNTQAKQTENSSHDLEKTVDKEEHHRVIPACATTENPVENPKRKNNRVGRFHSAVGKAETSRMQIRQSTRKTTNPYARRA